MAFNAKTFVNHGKNEKIVTLLGWAGAVDRNVAKYSQIYQDKGYTTVQFTSPARALGWGTKKSREVDSLADALDLLLLNKSNRLIFHIFSMNGFMSLCSLSLQYPELKVLEKCDGIFFDSCPIHSLNFGMETVKTHATVMQHVFDSMKLENSPLTAIAYKLFFWYETFRYSSECVLNNTMAKIGIVKTEDISSYHYILNHPNLPPVLSFVYSDKDLVCSSKQIYEFHKGIQDRKDCDRQIVTTRYTDSAHVEHFRKHGKEYRAQIDDFLERVENVRLDNYEKSKL